MSSPEIPLTILPGSETREGCILASGYPGPILRLGIDDGRFVFVPVKSFDAATRTVVWAFTLTLKAGFKIVSIESARRRFKASSVTGWYEE